MTHCVDEVGVVTDLKMCLGSVCTDLKYQGHVPTMNLY